MCTSICISLKHILCLLFNLQMVTAYQRENQLYCVRAKYVPNNPTNLKMGFQVVNSARQGSVTGTLVGSSGSGATSSTNSLFGGSTAIVAFPNGGSSATSASKLNVGPSFLSGFYLAGVKQAFGPYWVVAAGKKLGVLHMRTCCAAAAMLLSLFLVEAM
jgi:hypothetical protein